MWFHWKNSLSCILATNIITFLFLSSLCTSISECLGQVSYMASVREAPFPWSTIPDRSEKGKAPNYTPVFTRFSQKSYKFLAKEGQWEEAGRDTHPVPKGQINSIVMNYPSHCNIGWNVLTYFINTF